jgi:hypothetical protein
MRSLLVSKPKSPVISPPDHLGRAFSSLIDGEAR